MEIAYSRSSVGYLLGEVQIWVRLRYVAFCACVYLILPESFLPASLGAQNTLLIYIIYSGSASQSRVWTAY